MNLQKQHYTTQKEFYNIAFRTKIYRSIEELQKDLDEWIKEYNTKRTHQGKHCFGRTPMECFCEEKGRAQEKMIGFEKTLPQELVAAASVTQTARLNLETAEI